MQVDWELSKSFVAEGGGVRSACVLPPTAAATSTGAYQIVAGSQRGSISIFDVGNDSSTVVSSLQHDHSVTALLSPPKNGDLYVTGCKDTHIRLVDSSSQTIVATLKGHEKPVTSLSWVYTKSQDDNQSTAYLVSGSWDGTAKVWDITRQCLIATLPNHENSVCVAGLPSYNSPSNDENSLTIATGSAGIAQGNTIRDHTIRLWSVNAKTGQVQMLTSVANDHDGPIRGICTIGNSNGNNVASEIASCSNDGTVKLRDATPSSVQAHTTLTFAQLVQHPPMLLSVTYLSQSQSLVAAAEDGQVVVWNLDSSSTETQPQIIRHPSSVWQVLECPNGDFATCGDDGVLRIFTRSTDRMASESDRQAFIEIVLAQQQQQSSGPSPEEIAKLPQWNDRLARAGKSEGQVCVFQRDGIAIAAQWSATAATWIEVGQVMGNNDSNNGQGGGTIDGVAYDHVFPIEVDTTGGGVATLQIGYNNGENHFVAAQRFLDTHQLPQYHLQDVANYLQQRVGQGTSGPTLGSTSNMPAATTGVPIAAFQYIPSTNYYKIGLPSKNASETLAKMRSKMQEFGGVSSEEWAHVNIIVDALASNNADFLDNTNLLIIPRLLEVWPPDQAFAALDLARLSVLLQSQKLASDSTSRMSWDTIIRQAIEMCQPDKLPSEGPAANNIPMLTLRLCANAFAGTDASREAALSQIDSILNCTELFLSSPNKNTRLAIATLLHNLCYYSKVSGQQNAVIAQQVVTMINAIFKLRTYEGEAVFRLLVALGTLVMVSPEAKYKAQSLYMASQVEPTASPHGQNVKVAAKEVYAALQ